MKRSQSHPPGAMSKIDSFASCAITHVDTAAHGPAAPDIVSGSSNDLG